jgi:MEMO1 family protein
MGDVGEFMQAVHVSPYGGTWYPGRRTELERLLDELFACSEERTGSYLLADPLGFVVPHAGLEYSGAVAAAAYRYVRRQQPRRAVILGFAHRGGPPGISIPQIERYETPLGEAVVDRETVAALAAHQPFRMVAEDRICDHSVEIQLPLLQHAAPHAQVVPLFVGYLDEAAREVAAHILASLCDSETIFLVSSDLTHFGRAFGYQPFRVDSAISARLSHLDHSLMEAAASLDARFFGEAIGEHRATMCGRTAIALWLQTLALASGDEVFQEILDYRTSGDVTGDYEHTVSYGALGYFPWHAFCLDGDAQELLLDSADQTLRLLRATGEHRPFPPRTSTPALSRKAGMFVSLHQGERLLGCLGNRTSAECLAENVPEMTLRAALDDPRFPTVQGVEGDIRIEVSILSPMKPVRDVRAFRIGEHGATLECGGRQALLLPQVERGREWTSERFMHMLSVKAGLGTRGYQNAGARLQVFRAQVFGTNSSAS